MVVAAMPVPVVGMRGRGYRPQGKQNDCGGREIAELPVHRWGAPVVRGTVGTFAHRS